MNPHFNKETDKEAVKLLMHKYGSPLFIAYQEIIEGNIEKIHKALRRHYHNSGVFYSLKTNYIPDVVSVLKEHDINIEVVSGFEYWLAKKLGYNGSQIIFNGPDKKDNEIREALEDGALIHLDNENELRRVGNIVRDGTQSYNIGIRINIDLTQSLSEEDRKFFNKFPNKDWQRFGFNINGKEAYEAAKTLSECRNLKLKSIHVHLGSRIKSPRYYFLAAQYIADFTKKIKTDFKLEISQVDFGGGYYETPMEEYIALIASVFKSMDQNLRLIIEPGTYIINDAFFLATSVVHTSRLDDFQKVTVNASASLLFPAHFSGLPAETMILREEGREKFKSTIFGNSCINSDVLSREIYLPQLERDDIVVFPNVGAYTISKAEQFIFPRPAVILIKRGVEGLIRTREAYEDMVRLDHFRNEN